MSKVLVPDFVDGASQEFEVTDGAIPPEVTAALESSRVRYVASVQDRITVNKITRLDNGDLVWTPAQVDRLSGDGDYVVFNPLTGAHEPVTGAFGVLQAIEAIKAAFAGQINILTLE